MRVAFLGLALALTAGSAGAQDAQMDRLREALRRQTVDLRAAQDAQSALQAQLDAEKARSADLQKRLDTVSAAPPQLAEPPPEDPQLAELRATVAQLEAQARALQSDVTRWRSAYDQAAALARAKDAEAKQVAAKLAATQQQLTGAHGTNQRLAKVAMEILHLYETQDFRKLLLRSYEPVLALKKVELENLVQDYEDRIVDRTLPQAGGASR